MAVALWRCLFSQLFCFSLKSESDSNWKRNAKAIYPVLSMQKGKDKGMIIPLEKIWKL